MNRNIYHLIIALLLLVAFVQPAKAQDKHGFVQQEIIRVPGITTDDAINALSNIQKQTTRTYTDGMGRVLQSIGVDASPLQNDMIQPVAYDNLGRQVKAYLPYAGQATDTIGAFRSNAITTAQKAFYNQTSQYLIAVDTNAFTQQVFENSPLQRMLKSGTVGVGFQPLSGQHYKTVSYRYNSTTQDGNIPAWNPDGTFTASNYYGANALSVTDGIDEDNAETLTFTDKTGHIVLKRQKLGGTNLDTYYIYNLAGMISYIVPPKAVALMGGTLNLSTAGVNKLIYHYVYDNLGRPVEKTVPAQGRLFIVYDPLNRPVLMQDSNMRIVNKWNYIKYDVKGRPVSQGIYTDATRTSRTAMQTYVSGLVSSYNTAWYESRTATLTNNGYYTSTIFPTSSTGTLTPLAYAYFDDYDTDLNGSANFSYVPQSLPGEGSPAATTAAVKDMPTAVCKTTVGSGLSSTWLTKVTFYDKRGNPVQTQSNNQLYYSGMLSLTDKSTTVPDFIGVPQVNQVSKQTGATSTTITVQTSFTYDHMNRVKTVSQGYNGAAATVVAAYTYNELGQVVKKNLGFVSAGTYLQNVDMRYNVRGQLLSINNSKLSNDAGQTNGDTNDLFGLQILYDKTDANLGNTAYYNGKVSAVKWMSKDGSGNSSYERAFRYYYDAMGRDTAAIYAERTTAGTGAFTVTHGWDENRITYDQNGNILSLFRNATTQGTGGHSAIDNLTYTYDTANPNQLKTVADASGNANGFIGGTGNYTYDGNGNLAADPYKGIGSLTYNVLNRTDKISFSSSANKYIDYTYNADGSLIRKRQYDNVGGVLTLQNTTDYIDGFVYLNGTLQYFAMPEGRVLNSVGTLSREFTIADQQGNARISFDNTGTGGTAIVRQENSYYAFGLIMPGSVVGTPTNDNKHLYNGGSEWQNDYGNLPDYYQTYYRNYDAAIGRWIGVDPDPESAESMTVYQYGGNNPILFNDPLGNRAEYQDYAKVNQHTGDASQEMNNWLDEQIVIGGQRMAAAGQKAEYKDFWAKVFAVSGKDYDFSVTSYIIGENNGKIQYIVPQYGTNANTYRVVYSNNEKDPNAFNDYIDISQKDFYELMHWDLPANHTTVNSTGIDRAGAWDAGINILGGVAELVLGGEANPVQAVDGVGRILFNTIRLGAYLTGHKEFGDAVPTNLGGLVGKMIDGSNDFNKVGEWQKGLTAANDYAAFIFTLGNGGAWESLLSQKSSFLIRSTSVVGIAVNYYTFWSDSQPYKK